MYSLRPLCEVSLEKLLFFQHLTIKLGDATIPEAKLEWSCMDEASWKLDGYSLKPLLPPLHYAVESDEIDYHDYSLVVSGDVFRWMISYSPLETLQRVTSHHYVVSSFFR